MRKRLRDLVIAALSLSHVPDIGQDLVEMYRRRVQVGDRRVRALWFCVTQAAASGGVVTLELVRLTVGETGRYLREAATDVRASVRLLAKRPLIPGGIVLALAIGVGATVVLYSTARSLLFASVPGVADPDGAAYVVLRSLGGPDSLAARGLSLPVFDELRARSTLAEHLGSYQSLTVRVGLGPDAVTNEAANVIYGDYFDALGVRALAGRLLGPDENGPDHPGDLAVISESLARRLFGTPGAAVDRSIELNGGSYLVVGVTAGGFRGALRRTPTEVWLGQSALTRTSGFPREVLVSRESTMHRDMVARLRSHASPQALERQMATVLRGVAAEDPLEGRYLSRLEPVVQPGLRVPPERRASTLGTLHSLAGAVLLVMLLSLANAATLLVLRFLGARQAIDTRRAMGASTSRLVRQFLAEALLLGVLAAATGLLVAYGIGLALVGVSLPGLPPLARITIDRPLLWFSCGVSVAAALLVHLVPAVGAARGVRAAGRANEGLRRALSVVQVSLSISVLVGAGLLTRTTTARYNIDTGLQSTGVYTVPLDLGELTREPTARGSLYSEFLTGASATGAEVELAAYGPFESPPPTRIWDHGDASAPVAASLQPVSRGWFSFFGVPFSSGSTFPSVQGTGAAIPVVLTESLSGKLFPGTSPLGRQVELSLGTVLQGQIVGVARDLREVRNPATPVDAVFVPLELYPGRRSVMLLRTPPTAPSTITLMQSASDFGLRPMGPGVPATDRLASIFAEEKLLALMMRVLSGLALLLASLGVYSVTAHLVARRLPEFGVRASLGASGATIARSVLSETLVVLAVGGGIGVVCAFVFSQGLRDRLFGVHAADPLSYVLAVGVVALGTLVASAGPAWRAAHADPGAILRSEAQCR